MKPHNVMLGFLGVVVIVVVGFFAYRLFLGLTQRHYQAEDIQATCLIMGISSTEFCTTQAKVNAEDLDRALYSVYTPEVTTYSQLSTTITEPMYFDFGSCEAMDPTTTNLCPEPSRCSAAYSCYVITPADTIHFGFDSEGHLGGFSIPESK